MAIFKEHVPGEKVYLPNTKGNYILTGEYAYSGLFGSRARGKDEINEAYTLFAKVFGGLRRAPSDRERWFKMDAWRRDAHLNPAGSMPLTVVIRGIDYRGIGYGESWLVHTKVVAVAVVVPVPYSDGVGVLEVIAVEPQLQRQGFGNALMDLVDQEARVAGLGVLELDTNLLEAFGGATGFWDGAFRTFRVGESGILPHYYGDVYSEGKGVKYIRYLYPDPHKCGLPTDSFQRLWQQLI